MRHALLGMASCALALSLGLSTAEASTAEVKFRPTRDIAVDSVTGRLRKPTAAETAKLVADLKRMTARPTVVTTNAVAGKTGGRMAVLDGGFAGVMLARPRADGTYETRCVFSFEEGAEFLGLVANATM